LLKAASLAFLLLAALPAAGQGLYKWIDDSGKTQYSDRPPKNFKGEVTRIETEVEKTTLPPASPTAPAPPPAAPSTTKATGKALPPPPAEDILAKRRATRAVLEERLTKARAKVESTKKALEEAQSPEPEDRQVVQQRAVGGGMHGMAPRSNCRVEMAGNSKILMCPTSVPTMEYQDKLARLEEDVRKAEEELDAAQRAWRRGVD
jgi:exonuclease VII small subunit